MCGKLPLLGSQGKQLDRPTDQLWLKGTNIICLTKGLLPGVLWAQLSDPLLRINPLTQISVDGALLSLRRK